VECGRGWGEQRRVANASRAVYNCAPMRNATVGRLDANSAAPTRVGSFGARSYRRIRYPVTLLLALQYIALVVFPAVVNGNPYFWGIAPIVAVGLGASFVVETVVLTLGSTSAVQNRPIHYPRPLAAWTVMLIGAVALFGDISLGGGLYSTTVGISPASPLSSLATPFLPWLLIGCGFGLSSWSAGVMSRRNTLLLLTVALSLDLIAGIIIGKLAAVMDFGFALGAGLVLVRFLNARWLWVGLAVAVLSWPTLYALRNESRQAAYTAAGIANAVPYADASTRLREDVLMQRAVIIGEQQLPEPNALDILRFGLIPRFLDPGRGTISTPTELSVFLGEGSGSADTFTLLGTLWSFNGGYAGVVLYVGACAAAFALIFRRITPMRVSFAMLFVEILLWIEGTYPDDIAGLLQALLSLIVALGLARLLALRGHRGQAQSLPRLGST
jgi:hypothetical protein